MRGQEKLFAFFAWPAPVQKYLRDTGGWKLGLRSMAMFDGYFTVPVFLVYGLVPWYVRHSEEETDWMDLLHNLLWVDSGGGVRQ